MAWWRGMNGERKFDARGQLMNWLIDRQRICWRRLWRKKGGKWDNEFYDAVNWIANSLKSVDLEKDRPRVQPSGKGRNSSTVSIVETEDTFKTMHISASANVNVSRIGGVKVLFPAVNFENNIVEMESTLVPRPAMTIASRMMNWNHSYYSFKWCKWRYNEDEG